MPAKHAHNIKAQSRQFAVVLTPETKGWYSVTCPTLPGCHSQGRSVPEALANIREAIELVLEDMAANGEKPPSGDTLLATVQV